MSPESLRLLLPLLLPLSVSLPPLSFARQGWVDAMAARPTPAQQQIETTKQQQQQQQDHLLPAQPRLLFLQAATLAPTTRATTKTRTARQQQKRWGEAR